MSEANRQDCGYCLSSPCKCTDEEVEQHNEQERDLVDEYNAQYEGR